MLNMVRNAIALQLASYAGEKLIRAGAAGFRAFQTARSQKAAVYPAENLNAASEADIATLLPFRVTVADLDTSGAVGWACHDIYAVDANDATAWAFRHYSDEANLRVIVECMN